MYALEEEKKAIEELRHVNAGLCTERWPQTESEKGLESEVLLRRTCGDVERRSDPASVRVRLCDQTLNSLC